MSIPFETAALAKAGRHAPDDHRPFEGAPERSERHVHTRTACRADLLLKPVVRLLQFADILRGQIAPGVDAGDQGGARGNRTLGGGTRMLRLLLSRA